MSVVWIPGSVAKLSVTGRYHFLPGYVRMHRYRYHANGIHKRYLGTLYFGRATDTLGTVLPTFFGRLFRKEQ
jgi:hypothetical protein